MRNGKNLFMEENRGTHKFYPSKSLVFQFSAHNRIYCQFFLSADEWGMDMYSIIEEYM